jgi:hypothetical protein
MPDGINVSADFSHVGTQQESVDWRVSGQFASRPSEERYTSLDDMLDMMISRQSRSDTTNMPISEIEADLTKDGRLGLAVQGAVMDPTNYSFQQYCQHIGVPAAFISRALGGNPRLARDVLRHALNAVDDPSKEVQAFHSGSDLRGITGPNYGRIWDADMVRSIKRVTEDSGISWEVPIAFRQPGHGHYESIDVTKDETTLYASDRDHFGFLVDQQNPIEAGKLPNGDPDLYFRGFYFWNGECGGMSNGIATFLYRWVCCNRSIRGQKGFERISIVHRAGAAELFVKRLVPALKGFVNGSATGIIDGMNQARRHKIARNDDDRLDFLTREGGFGPKEADTVMQLCITEEGHPIESVYDAVQAMTAFARTIPYQFDRVQVERRAGKIMDDVLA